MCQLAVLRSSCLIFSQGIAKTPSPKEVNRPYFTVFAQKAVGLRSALLAGGNTKGVTMESSFASSCTR